MYGFVLQDWVTVRSTNFAAANYIVQSESAWMPFSSFQDVIFWCDIREVGNPGTGTITLSFETSPTKDDSLFQAMVSQTSLAPATPLLLKVLLSNATTPLATWVRWKLSPVSGSAGPWDVTFRVLVAANMVGRAQALPQGAGTGMSLGGPPSIGRPGANMPRTVGG